MGVILKNFFFQPTLLECRALLRGEGGSVPMLAASGLLVVAADRLQRLSVAHFLCNQWMEICITLSSCHAHFNQVLLYLTNHQALSYKLASEWSN